MWSDKFRATLIQNEKVTAVDNIYYTTIPDAADTMDQTVRIESKTTLFQHTILTTAVMMFIHITIGFAYKCVQRNN